MTRRKILTVYCPVPIDVIAELATVVERHWPGSTIEPLADGTAFDIVIEDPS